MKDLRSHPTDREFFSKPYWIKPKPDCIYDLRIDLEPSGHPFGSKSIGAYHTNIWFRFDFIRFLSVCINTIQYILAFFFFFFNIDRFEPSSHYISYWKLFWQTSYRKDTLLKVVPNICWTSRRSNSHIMRSIHISGSFYYLLMQFAGSNIYTHSHTYVHKYLYYASIGFTVYNHTQQYYTIV